MKLRARAEVMIFKRNRVLCGFRKDYVCFPGGGIDANESAKDAAIRETWEESGRKLIHPTVAHPPSIQIWPKEYSKGKDHEGGQTYWMIGSAADLPVPPADRHDDYEAMYWHPVKEVIRRLKKEMTKGWADDVAVRIKILETHLGMQRTHKTAGLLSLPEGMVLSCLKPF